MEISNRATRLHPVQLTIPRPERSSRLLALASLLFMVPKLALVIPHVVVLYVLGIFGFLCAAIAQVAVLFTGRYPEGLHEIVAGVIRWQVRVNAFVVGLTDAYPPFRLSP